MMKHFLLLLLSLLIMTDGKLNAMMKFSSESQEDERHLQPTSTSARSSINSSPQNVTPGPATITPWTVRACFQNHASTAISPISEPIDCDLKKLFPHFFFPFEQPSQKEKKG